MVVQTENRHDGAFHGKLLRHLSRIKFWESSETSVCRFDTVGEVEHVRPSADT